MSLLFPEEPRTFPFRRTVRTLLRTLHILAIGTLLGGHIFEQPVELLEPWLWASVISGLLLLATDMHASFEVFFQVHGLVVLLKVALLMLVPVFWEQRVWILIAVLVIGSVSSHMPGRFRHYRLLPVR
ncbi:MAG: hypothetical protein KDJ38_11210 [Gammaproteobacteria bacterium]|nr:hypothetical protein [Gammaproteobacteria bacterium]